MIITKNEKQYLVSEKASVWCIALQIGALTTEFHVSKEICKTLEDVREYIEKEDMF